MHHYEENQNLKKKLKFCFLRVMVRVLFSLKEFYNPVLWNFSIKSEFKEQHLKDNQNFLNYVFPEFYREVS